MKCILTLGSEYLVLTLLPNNMQTALYGIVIIPVIYVGSYNDFLWAEWFGAPIPGGGVRFSAPVQTGPGAHPGPGVKPPGLSFTTHPHLAPRLKKRI